MTDQDNIQDELGSMNSGLPANGGQPLFSIPDGYFDGLAATILAKVKSQNTVAEELTELSPFLASLPKAMPYSLPDGYFGENLSALPVLFNETESTLLNAVGKTLPYTVPQGYFENLPQQMLARLAQPEKKVVSLFSRNWVRAAVAAVVGGIVFISGYQYFYKSDDVQTANRQSVDTSKILVAKNEQAILQDLKKADTKELDEFIKTVSVVPASVQVKSSSADKGEVETLLKGVSEKEIDNFLEQLPNADEDLVLMD